MEDKASVGHGPTPAGQDQRSDGMIAAVLAGGGARGAYEAGALAELLPILERNGRRPRMFVGTSAGALNAALFASVDHLPATEAAQVVLDTWRHVGRENVIKPIISSGLRAGFSYLAQLFGLGAPLTGILDTSPLAQLLEHRLDWAQLHRNTAAQRVVVAVAATACNNSRSVVFVEGAGEAIFPAPDFNRSLDYVSARLGPQHLMASAAIPVVFSPIWVDGPAATRGWYLDGGIRLNVPIKPAVALGAERVVVVATDPYISRPAPPTAEPARPDIYSAMAELMQACLVDRMIEDLRTLGKINELLLRHGSSDSDARSPSSGRLHRLIPYLFVGPSHTGSLARLTEEVVRRDYSHGRWLRNGLTFPLLNRLFEGSGKVRGELLSYLFFEHGFIEAAIRMGQRDVRRLLGHETAEMPWQMTS